MACFLEVDRCPGTGLRLDRRPNLGKPIVINQELRFFGLAKSIYLSHMYLIVCGTHVRSLRISFKTSTFWQQKQRQILARRTVEYGPLN